MDNNLMLMPDIVCSLSLSGDMLRVRVVICKQEEFDGNLNHRAFEKLVEALALVIEWSRSLGVIKDELLVTLLLAAADELNFDISSTVRCHPQIQSIYEKLKLRYEFTGRFKPLTGLEEDMPCEGEGPGFLY